MKVVVIGAGFTGLSAAYRLLKEGHEVIVLEKESDLGGLATGYIRPGWKWYLDRAYHHLFTNDYAAINLAQEIGQKLIHITPKTCVQARGKIIPFDSPTTLLRFPYLSLINRVRTGIVLAYLKITNDYKWMERHEAVAWIKRFMGNASYRAIWEPLFRGKFHDQSHSVMLPWFWARIKKRTQSLYYPQGGFTAFLKLLAKRIEEKGGTILVSTPVIRVTKHNGRYRVVADKKDYLADHILYTGPTVGFPYLFGIPLKPKRKPHQYLSAQILVLRFKKPFLRKTYWLNITDPNHPFLVLVDHTNFVNPRYYGGEHLVYVGNYLPPNHPYLGKKPAELLRLFHPFLNKIKPGYRASLIGYDVFTLPYAQAVVNADYVSNMSKKGTGLSRVYMANIDSVYPWDRGTNYAIEKGEQIAKIIQSG
jgi:protoporphyrinogen oxidase